jgi:F-type H+-transporting ATPase subunit b
LPYSRTSLKGVGRRHLPGYGCDQREIRLRAAAKTLLSVSLGVGAVVTPTVASAAGDLNLAPQWPIVLTDLAVFGLLIYPVNRLLISPMLRVVEQRHEKTVGALDEASELEREASQLSVDLEAGINEARGRAHARRASILAAGEEEERGLMTAASADAAQAIDAVRKSIASDLAEARGALESDAQSLAREAASRLLGRPIG